MPINPTIIERLVLFRLNRAPAPFLDLFGAAGFRTVALAVDLGVFDALDGETLSVADLATELGVDPDGLEPVLTFLDALGYVTTTGTGYTDTAMTKQWLTDATDTNIGPWFTFWNELVFPYWDDQIRTTITAGEPTRTIYEWFDDDPSRWETAQAGFRAVAALLADEVTANVTVPDTASRLLDVGGGHGLYAVELCNAHPHLEATVFDTPTALAAARKEIAAADLEDRISVTGGDYMTDDLGTEYDIAYLFNVIHAHNGETNTQLFERVADALRPGGRIVILDQFKDSTRLPVGQAALGFVGLTYHTTLGAEIHEYESVKSWLDAAGFEAIDRTSIRRGGPGNDLIQASNPV